MVLKEILNKFDRCLDKDLASLQHDVLKGDAAASSAASGKTRDGQQKQFAGYLVSVATHPIGLRASISPFNCPPEQMLALIMDMFNLTDGQMTRMLQQSESIGTLTDRQRYDTESAASSQAPTGFKKRHAWRPELRIRLRAPTFFRDNVDQLDNLIVRVFLFKRRGGLVGSSSTKQQEKSYLFENFKLDVSSTLIKPLGDAKCVVRFVKVQTGEQASLSHRIVHSSPGNNHLDEGDIFLRIKRHYCDPKSAYILRFEYWLRGSAASRRWHGKHRESNYWKKIKRFAICQWPSNCCCKQTFRPNKTDHPQLTDSIAGESELYGYTNIGLTRIPSYAIKKVYPILSLRERRIDTCEISLDIRNRRIIATADDDNIRMQSSVQPQKRKQEEQKSGDQEKPQKSSQEFIVNHLRLYSKCFLYQADQAIGDDHSPQATNLTLDNLFFLPVYSLLNQHRLQSNLNQLEDQSLRRAALISLLLKIDKHYKPKAGAKGAQDSMNKKQKFERILISIIQNEYLIAHRSIDEKTLEEVDPFRSDTVHDSCRLLIVNLELILINNLFKKFLETRLRRWLMDPSEVGERLTAPSERCTTLAALRLCKTIISHFKRTKAANARLKVGVIGYEEDIQNLLRDIIVTELKLRFGTLTKRGNNNFWRDVMRDIRRINHDLSLYWSRKGIDGLLKDNQESTKLDLTAVSAELDLISTIQAKMSTFLD